VREHRAALAADTAPEGPRRGDAVFKRILVPLDLSRRNQRTLDTARELAQLHRARVTLLHVVHQIPDLAVSELSGFYRRLERLAMERLERIAAPLTARGLPVGVAVCVGEPAREIVRSAVTRKIDLIVMGSHKVAPRPPSAGWGTTSYKVGIFCRCPILLVK
jgi:nucleotide-binding universal stress UspA family protein